MNATQRSSRWTKVPGMSPAMMRLKMVVMDAECTLGAMEAEVLAPNRYLTIPNAFTLLRLCCIPLFLYLLFPRDNQIAAAWLLGGLGATDWVDGWLARRLHQTSEFGKMFDPTVDRILFIVAIVYALFAFSLREFPWTRGLAENLVQFVVEPLQSMGLAVLRYLPKLAFLIVLVVVIRYVLKLLGLFFDAVHVGRVPLRGFDAEWARPTYQIVRILIVLLSLVIAYPYLPGSGSAAFQGLSIFAGLMLSLGASSAMASIIAGYTVTYRRAFRVGDRITVGEYTGEVTEVRLMVTHLRTTKNEEVVVPNSVVLQSHVVNYSKLAKTHGLILHTTVSIGYEIPWRQVEAMLLLAAERTGLLLNQPPPFVLERALGDFAVTYELNVCVESAAAMPERYAALHRNILDVFNEYGVQIMTPAYEGDPPEPKLVPQERWFSAPAVTAAASRAPAART